MLIVVEGVDGAGKTTFVEQLAESLAEDGATTVLHSGPPQDHPTVEYEQRLLDYSPDKQHHVVCDRWHVGELIYGPLYRGRSLVTPALNRHIEMFLRSRGALRILMDTPLDDVRRRLRLRGDDLLHPQHVERVWRHYRFHCADERYSFITRPTPTTVDAVIAAARKRQDAVQRLQQRWPTYVGPIRPKTLLLGERRNHADFPSAFVPLNGTSGEFLLRHLELVQARDYGMANALEEEWLRSLWVHLGKPRVVALGNAALKVARENFIPYTHVPHPQWVRRFAHRRGIEYAERIARATPGYRAVSRERIRAVSGTTGSPRGERQPAR